MDAQRGVCVGCCRTLDEIGRWGAMSELERQKILGELPQRREQLDVPEVSVPPEA
jgi:predicted Fe-S protein YdhL (DUF1289 family)